MENVRLTGYPSMDKPWLKYYSDEVKKMPLPKRTMYEYILQNNKDYPNDTALIYFGKKISYGEMFEMIDKTARAFTAIGVKEGDICTVLMLNQPEMVYILYALNKIGAVCCVVNVLSSEQELVHYLDEGKSKYFIALDVFFDKSYKAAKEYGIEKMIYVPLWQSLGKLKNKIYRLKVKKPSVKDDFVMSWEDFISKSVEGRDITAKYQDGKCTVIGHTGGTTGMPKGVMLTDLSFNSIVFQEIPAFDFERQDTFLDLIVPFAIYGLCNNLHASLSFGLQVILIPKVDADKTDELVLKYKPNHIASIPSYWTAIVESDKIKDLSFMKSAAAGGSGMTVDFEKKLNKKLKDCNSPAYFMNGYGMSELGGGVCLQTRETAVAGSVGIPLWGATISAFDTETNEEKKFNEVGELCVKAPSMMLGYISNAEETANVLRQHKDGVWMHTGDLGYINEDGVVFVNGRIKRLYLTLNNGVVSKIFPDRIEKTVMENSAVKECCAVCISADGKKYLPIVYYTPHDDNTPAQEVEEGLKALCQKELSDYAQPSRFIKIKELPRNAMGKVDYRALEQQAAETK